MHYTSTTLSHALLLFSALPSSYSVNLGTQKQDFLWKDPWRDPCIPLKDAVVPITPPENEAWTTASEYCISPPTKAFWTDSRGAKMHQRSFVPPSGQVKGTIFFVPGLGAHMNTGIDKAFYEDLASAGYVVAGYDPPGHGYSPGDRALVCDLNDWVDDTIAFVNLVMSAPSPKGKGFELNFTAPELKKVQEKNYWLMGTSLSGVTSMIAATKLHDGEVVPDQTFLGAILISPALEFQAQPAWVYWMLKIFVVPWISKGWELPTFFASTQVKPEDLFFDDKDKECVLNANFGEQNRGINYGGNVKWGTGLALMAKSFGVKQDMKKVKYKFMIMHDPDDPTSLITGSETLMALSPSTDKTLEKMPQCMHHPPWNCREDAVRLVTSFLNRTA